MRVQTITLMRFWIQMDTATWWKFWDSGEVMITFYIWKVHESLGAEGQTSVCRIRFPILPSPLVYTRCVTLGLSMWILLPKLIFVTQHTVHLIRRRLTRWACPSHKQRLFSGWLQKKKSEIQNTRKTWNTMQAWSGAGHLVTHPWGLRTVQADNQQDTGPQSCILKETNYANDQWVCTTLIPLKETWPQQQLVSGQWDSESIHINPDFWLQHWTSF